MTGRITAHMLSECGLPEPADDVLILHSGPKGLKKTLFGILEKGNYIPNNMYV